MGWMAVGESVKNGALWNIRRPPKGNSALPSMEALLGGPYITPSTHGIRIDTTDEKLEHKESSFTGESSKDSKEGSSQGEFRGSEALQGASEMPVTWEEHLSPRRLSS